MNQLSFKQQVPINPAIFNQPRQILPPVNSMPPAFNFGLGAVKYGSKMANTMSNIGLWGLDQTVGRLQNGLTGNGFVPTNTIGFQQTQTLNPIAAQLAPQGLSQKIGYNTAGVGIALSPAFPGGKVLAAETLPYKYVPIKYGSRLIGFAKTLK